MPKEYKFTDKPIEDISMLEPEATYSYADYLRWSFQERVELIKGKVFRMAPAPNRLHQKVSGSLFSTIHFFLKNKRCEVYSAPFDVRLPKRDKGDREIHNVVQPDICVICDKSKLDDAGCIGAPDIIIEILSPATAAKDLKNKFELYEENGVTEYWIVYPGEQIVEIFRLENTQKYGLPVKYLPEDTIRSEVLPGLEINLQEIFANG